MRSSASLVSLVTLCLLGLGGLAVETVRGGDPSRGFVIALLVWSVLLVVALVFARLSDRSAR